MEFRFPESLHLILLLLGESACFCSLVPETKPRAPRMISACTASELCALLPSLLLDFSTVMFSIFQQSLSFCMSLSVKIYFFRGEEILYLFLTTKMDHVF